MTFFESDIGIYTLMCDTMIENKWNFNCDNLKKKSENSNFCCIINLFIQLSLLLLINLYLILNCIILTSLGTLRK